MDKRILMWVIIAALFVAVVFMTFKVGAMTSGSSAIQAAGTAAKSAASTASYGGMVGGC